MEMHQAVEPTESPSLKEALEEAVSRALREDIGPGDLTTQACVDPELEGVGFMVAKQEGIVAGLPVAEAAFKKVDQRLLVTRKAEEGEAVKPGTVLLIVEGTLASQLTAERVALNFVQRLSGIATMTRHCVEAARGVTILDTRKTTPGLRALERYAVRVGGGKNWREGLFDKVLIKDNHIEAAGGLREAVERIRAAYSDRYPVVAEVRSLKELEEALELELDRVMLDNFCLEDIREAVRMTRGRVPLEVSGQVEPETIEAVAACGVDFISVGALTHAARALDISFTVKPKEAAQA